MCNEAGVRNLVEVAFHGKNSNISLEAACNCPRLCTGSLIRFLERHPLAGFLQPIGLKLGEQLGESILHDRVCANDKRDVAVLYGRIGAAIARLHVITAAR
ncbi:hypothetical protein D3C78_1678080 [compost metagenome]